MTPVTKLKTRVASKLELLDSRIAEMGDTREARSIESEYQEMLRSISLTECDAAELAEGDQILHPVPGYTTPQICDVTAVDRSVVTARAINSGAETCLHRASVRPEAKRR